MAIATIQLLRGLRAVPPITVSNPVNKSDSEFTAIRVKYGNAAAYAHRYRYQILAGAAVVVAGVVFVKARRSGAWGRRKDSMLTYGKASARPMSGVKAKAKRRGRR